MKVKELIEMLKAEDQEREVICAKDAEGNGFSPLHSCDTGKYIADSTWSGERGLEDLTEQLIEQGFGDEDVIIGGVKALFLCPVN
jgi:hypothetical protein